MKRIVILAAIVILAQGCWVDPSTPEFPVGTVQGYRPVYRTFTDSPISFGAPRPLKKPGKIYLYGNALLINEQYEGVHLFNNADPANPTPMGFLSIAGNLDVAIRNGVLYADHLGDLVAIDISTWSHPREISRVHQTHWVNSTPPADNSYFECPDTEKGVVVGWELTTLHNPTCFR